MPHGTTAPCTGGVLVLGGGLCRAAARNGDRSRRGAAENLGGDLEPYGYRMLGQVATLGRYKGVADVMGVRFRGFPG